MWVPNLCGHEFYIGMTILHARGHFDWVIEELIKETAAGLVERHWCLAITLGAPKPATNGPILEMPTITMEQLNKVLSGTINYSGPIGMLVLLGLGNIGKVGDIDSYADYRIRAGKTARKLDMLGRDHGVAIVAVTNPPYSWKCPKGVTCIGPKRLKRLRKECRNAKN